MKVTSHGEKVIALLHELIAAKGYEQDTYFEMAIRSINMLPKLEGTEHVNMALIIKFVPNYFFGHIDYPPLERREEPADDAYLFRHYIGGLSRIKSPYYRLAYQRRGPAQRAGLPAAGGAVPPAADEDPAQTRAGRQRGTMLAAGKLFTLAAYAQLVRENARLLGVDDEVLNYQNPP